MKDGEKYLNFEKIVNLFSFFSDNLTFESALPPTPVDVVVNIESEADDSGNFSESRLESSNTSAASEMEENPKKKWRKSKNSTKRQAKLKIAEESSKPKVKRRYSKIFSIGCF